MRIIPKNVLYLVWWKTVKNQSDIIRLIPRHRSEWIWARIDSDWSGLKTWFRIHSDWCLGINRIDFWPFSIKRDTKRFSDWFGMIRIGSDTDIGMNRNSSDWVGKNFSPILSPGLYRIVETHFENYSYIFIAKCIYHVR